MVLSVHICLLLVKGVEGGGLGLGGGVAVVGSKTLFIHQQRHLSILLLSTAV